MQRAWKDKLDSELFAKLQCVIFRSQPTISFDGFAEFYYKLVEGTVDDKTSVIFSIICDKGAEKAQLSSLRSVSTQFMVRVCMANALPSSYIFYHIIGMSNHPSNYKS